MKERKELIAIKIIAAPGTYIQGIDAISKLAEYAKQPALLIVDPYVYEHLLQGVTSSFEQDDYEVEVFTGEVTTAEIDRITNKHQSSNFKSVIGIGGGKTVDASKAVAYKLAAQTIVVPTIAATDASTSRHSVIYDENGKFDHVLHYEKNPDVVLVDTEIIAKAPVRFLVSGMGDALATYFEARAAKRMEKSTIIGGQSSMSAQYLARLSYEILTQKGSQAKKDVLSGQITEAVDQVIEANIFLSGIGFESGGLSIAHALHGGFTSLPETLDRYHGERVAYGTLVGLVLEEAAEIDDVLEFMVDVGLPVTLGEIGIVEVTREKLMQVARIAYGDGQGVYAWPDGMTIERLYDALIAANAKGEEYLKNKN